MKFKLKFADEALSHFDDIQKPAQGKKFTGVVEKPLSQPIQVYGYIRADSDDKQMTHHVLAWLLPTITDPRLRLSLRLMEGVS